MRGQGHRLPEVGAAGSVRGNGMTKPTDNMRVNAARLWDSLEEMATTGPGLPWAGSAGRGPP